MDSIQKFNLLHLLGLAILSTGNISAQKLNLIALANIHGAKYIVI